jgi:predicted ATPase
LRVHDPERDRDAKFHFGQDTSAGATSFLAEANWLLGSVRRGRDLIEGAVLRSVESGHVPTLANTYQHKVFFEILRDDPEAVLRATEPLVSLCREHGLALHLAWGTVVLHWARAHLIEREVSLTEFREALAQYTARGTKISVPLFRGLLAKIEAEGQGAEGALAEVDRALALASETGEHWTDSFLHRIRGEILLLRDPANPAAAEEAFHTAIAIARLQKAKSFELRAALSLAKLYQSTGRAADAHAVLAPAVEGFSPTAEFQEIEEAQRLLAARRNGRCESRCG